MNLSIRENQWPTVDDPKDLERTGEEIVMAVEEMEDGWNRRDLQAGLRCDREQSLLGHKLIARYRSISFPPAESLRRYRKKWMQNAFDEFRRAWNPPVVVFRAGATDSLGNDVVVIGDKEVAVRTEQAQSSRFWQVGIECDNHARSLHLARTFLRKASERLTRDIDCIGRLCCAYSCGRLPHADRIHWGGRGRGIAFERLIADILNEKKFCASRAPLYEDLFEWTDLRVQYPGLNRKRGVRVQVKLIGDEIFESLKVARWKHQRGYVIVSPVRLARYVESCLAREEDEIDGEAFWNCIGGEPADARELALALYDLFDSAIASNNPHPLGPMAQVPAPIRHLVQSYVRTAAFSANKQ